MPYEFGWRLRTTQLTPLHWSILGSSVIHILVLWQFRFSVIYFPVQSLTQFAITLVSTPTPEPGISSIQESTAGQQSSPLLPRRAVFSPQAGNTAKTATESASTNLGQSSGTAAGGSTGIEGAVTDPGGVAVGGSAQGPVGGAPARQVPPGSGSGSGSGGGPGVGSAGLGSKPGAPKADPYVIAIPPTIRGSTASFEGAVYAEAERFVLHGRDLRMGIPVPANEICLDGDILRTIDRASITQTITDYSKCEFRLLPEGGEIDVCPADAHTRGIVFDGYLASPVNYSINTCLEYDKSHCSEQQDDDGTREVCRGSVKYEGIWAAGTKFEYRCVKSEIQTFSHPLQYTVRFIEDYQGTGVRVKQRVLGKEIRQIPPCQ